MSGSSRTIAERFSSKLIISFVSIIAVTTMVAGTLAYWLTQSELEKQAWARLHNGQRVTLALLAADRARLDNLVALTAQRPTLQQLLLNADTVGLRAYLEQFQAATPLDLLVVHDAGGQIAAPAAAPPLCATPIAQQAATFCLSPGPLPHLSLQASQPVLDSNSGRLLGYVTLALIIDEAYEERLAVETGLEQSVLVEGRRIASSLNEAGSSLPETTTAQALAASRILTGTLTAGENQYFTALFPLGTAGEEPIALAEVALPVNDVKAAERRILMTLAASTLFIAAAASVTSLLLRKNINDEALQHLRSHFLATVTHEFRTPLSALRASVEFLVDEMASLSREEIDGLLHAVHLSVTGLQTLVDNLLESIRIEAGHFTIRPEPTELEEVVAEAEHIMQPLLNRRQQKLALSYPERMPMVYGDPTRLTQVIVNLLANASKYGPMGQTVDLELALTDGEMVRVTVADRGPGLSPAIREKLFRRFARFSSADEAQHGVGLGLWIVKAIISEHGGTVGAEERPGGGAIFWFTLPIMASAQLA